MAKHKHTVQRDRVHDMLGAVTQLGERKIPTMMTWTVAEIKSALRHEAEKIDDAHQMLMDQYTEGKREPSKVVEGKTIPGKFVPDVVYAVNEDGSPKFKTDKAGKVTTDREIAQGKVQLTNSVAYTRELRDFDRGTCEVEVPHVSWPALEGKVPSLEANITEALMDFFDDFPKDRPAVAPAEKKPTARPGAKAPAEAAAT